MGKKRLYEKKDHAYNATQCRASNRNQSGRVEDAAVNAALNFLMPTWRNKEEDMP